MIIFLLVGCFYSDSANVQWELSLRRESTELQMPPAAAKTNVSARGLWLYEEQSIEIGAFWCILPAEDCPLNSYNHSTPYIIGGILGGRMASAEGG